MGSYRITIEGVGCHHNGREGVVDSDAEAAKLVTTLRENGHSLTAARFELTGGSSGVTYSTDNLLDGSRIVGQYVPPTPPTAAGG
jgi:hypothetical protein